VRIAVARVIVRIAAWMVPSSLRSRWREEWLGEIEGQRAEGKGQREGQKAKGRGREWRTLRAALGAPWDAIVLRGRSARGAGRSVGAGFQTDLSQTVRALWRTPSHVATVVICLGIGTSISVSVFSALNALLFGEMPGVADRRSVVRLSLRYEAGAGTSDRIYVSPRGGQPLTGGPWSTSDFEMLAANRGGALSCLAVEGDWRFDITLDRDPVNTTGAFVSGAYFDVLGTTPSMGRLLKPTDDRADAPAVAVIGYHLWQERFDGKPNIVGRSILVADRPFTVVGVAPPRFTGVQPTGLGASPLNATQLWLPLHHAIGWPGVPDREVPWHSAVGRLGPGATQDDARTAMMFGAQRLAAAHPLNRRGAIVIVHDHTLGPNDSPLEILTMVTVLLSLPLTVLLIGCANVANLQIARATERARELSVRCALGASRAQVIRLLTCEAAILAVLSVGAGWLGAQVILTIAQPSFPVALALDGRVLAFALLLTVGVTVLSGLTPAWLSTRRADLMLRHTGRTGGLGHSRLRHALVIVQMALSLALLATSGLFMASLRAMRDEVPPAARTTLVAPLDVDTLGYTAADTRQLRDEITAQLAQHPSVQSVAAERMVGFRYWAPTDAIDARRYIAGGYVTASWFETVSARLVAGRFLRESDGGTTAVVSERLARELVPNGSALGRLIYLSNSVIAAQSHRRYELARPLPGQGAEIPVERLAAEIVGVIADMPRRAGDAQPDPVVYLPLPADSAGLFTLRVRTSSPDELVPQVREIIRHAERRLAGVNIQSAETLFLRESGPIRAMALSIGGLGLIALLLAAAGLYAVMAYLVSVRRQELGLRLAIGARPADVLTLVLRQGLRLAIIGSVAGFAIAIPIAMGLRASVTGVSPLDPAAMLPPAITLIVVTLLASTIPARRAARIDPIRALREE